MTKTHSNQQSDQVVLNITPWATFRRREQTRSLSPKGALNIFGKGILAIGWSIRSAIVANEMRFKSVLNYNCHYPFEHLSATNKSSTFTVSINIASNWHQHYGRN